MVLNTPTIGVVFKGRGVTEPGAPQEEKAVRPKKPKMVVHPQLRERLGRVVLTASFAEKAGVLKGAIKARNDNDFAISIACKVTSSDGRFMHMSEDKVMKPKEKLSFKRCEAAADVRVDWFWEPCKSTPLPPVVKEIELDGIRLIRTTCAGRNDSKCKLR